MQRNSRSRSSMHEAGQSLVLVALMMPVLLGFVGLSIDFGRLAVQQRKLQDYADSAALAGAQDLSVFKDTACPDANTSLTANNNPATVICNVTSGRNPDDTITVKLTESLPLDFLPVLGLNAQTVTAKGVAITSSVTGCSDPNGNNKSYVCAPYASWRPTATSGCPDQFQVGMTIVFRANGWSAPNLSGASSCPAAWNVNSADFKGFLRPIGSSSCPNGICSGNDTITTHGGNACGQEPVQDIQTAYTNHTDLVIPVLDSGAQNGNSTIHVPGFITIRLNYTYPYVNQIQSVALNGPPTSGQFTVTYGGQTTGPIDFNASPATVQSAVAALSSVGAGNVTVAGPAAGIYVLTFGGSLNLTSLGTITATSWPSSPLSGGTSPAISVAQTETNSSRAGSLSQVSDYTCPATWYATVVNADTTIGTRGGVSDGAACNSTFFSCQVRLLP